MIGWLWCDLAAAEDWAESPRQLLSQAKGASDGKGDYTVVASEERVSLGADGVTTTVDRWVVHVRTAPGVEQWSTVVASWAPALQDRPEVAARVVTPDGQQFELDPTRFVEAVAAGDDPTLLQDTRELRAVLPRVVPGAVIEAVVTTQDRHPLRQAGRTWVRWLQAHEPTHHQLYVFDVPAEIPLRWQALEADKVELQVKDRTSGGRHTLQIALSTPDRWQMPPDALPSGKIGAPVLVVGTGASWEAVSSAYHALVEPLLRPEPLQAEIARVLAAPEGERVAVATAIARDEVRYTGVEFGESRIVPQAPRVVLDQGWGDCKDKAALLVVLLRAAGIEAEVALLQAGFGPVGLPERFPSGTLFNHVIVYLPAKDLWIDPTSTWSAPGELPLSDQDKLVLPVRAQGAALVRTPHQVTRLTSTMRYDLSQPGQAHITDEILVEGHWAPRYHAGITAVPADQREEVLVGSVVEVHGTNELDVAVKREVAGPFSMTVQVDDPIRSQSVAGRAWMHLDTAALSSSLPEVFNLVPGQPDDPATGRTEPYAVGPMRVSLTSDLVMPRGFVLDAPPEDRRWTLAGEAYISQELRESDPPRLQLVLDTGAGLLQPDDVHEVREALLAIREHATDLTARHPAQKALDDGDVTAAWSALQPALKQGPQLHERVLQAQVLAQAGFPQDAIALLQQERLAHPASPTLLLMLGTLLAEHDPAAALEVLRHTQTLDPGYTPVTLAKLLLEHGHHDELVALARARRDEGYEGPSEDALQDMGLRALLLQGRLQEAKALAAGSERVTAEILAYRLLSAHPRPFEGHDGEAQVGTEAMMIALAAALEHPALREPLRSIAPIEGLLEAFEQIDALPAEPTTPQEACASLILRVMQGEDPGKLLAPTLRSEGDALTEYMRTRPLSFSMPRGLLAKLDAAVWLIAEVSGDDAGGYRVSHDEDAYYLRRHRGRFEILGMSDRMTPLARLLDSDPALAPRAAEWLAQGLSAARGLDPADAAHRKILAQYLLAEERGVDMAVLKGAPEPLRGLALAACGRAGNDRCSLAMATLRPGTEALQVRLLLQLDRAAEAQAIVKASPESERAMLQLHYLLGSRDWTAAAAALEALPASVRPDALVNDLAWGLLISGDADEAARVFALVPPDRRSGPMQHTAACIALAQGDHRAALTAWLAVRTQPELDPNWSYVEGMLARHFQLEGTAQAAFARLPRGSDPLETRHLLTK